MIGFVFHILGYPYGLSTSQSITDAIDANLSVKRKIYGGAAAAGIYLADSVPTFDLLEPPGRQSISLHSEGSKLKGGNWTARISNQDIGYIWPLRSDTSNGDNTTVKVLDGIANIPNINYDHTINWGELWQQLNGASGPVSMNWTETIGGDLTDKVDAAVAADDFCILWIGNEAVAATTSVSSDTDKNWATVTRGAYKSKISTHLVEDFEASNTIIADVPINGAAGRYYELFMVEIDDDTGALLDEPFLFRYGQIQNDVNIGREFIEMSCGAINSAIEKNINFDTRPGHLNQYVLSRPEIGCRVPRAHGPTPHLWVYEGIDFRPIWLCGQEETVTFDTKEELLEAIQQELNLCSAGSSSQKSGSTATSGDKDEYHSLLYQYYVTNNGIYFTDDNSLGYRPRIGGLLPWLMGLFVFDMQTLGLDEYDAVAGMMGKSVFHEFVAGLETGRMGYAGDDKATKKGGDEIKSRTLNVDDLFISALSLNWGVSVLPAPPSVTVDMGSGTSTDNLNLPTSHNVYIILNLPVTKQKRLIQ